MPAVPAHLSRYRHSDRIQLHPTITSTNVCFGVTLYQQDLQFGNYTGMKQQLT